VGELPHEAAAALEDMTVELVRTLTQFAPAPLLARPSRLELLLEEMRATVRRRLDDPDLSPATLSALHGASVRSVYNAFALIGTTPAGYIRSRRLARGADLLRATDASVVDIAITCGFSDAGTFARAFRKTHSAGPASWRAAGGTRR
jgi:transcriptional regulator GlxA family with amidase domain